MSINGKELKSGDDVWILVQQYLPTYHKVKIDKVSKDKEFVKISGSKFNDEEFPVSKIVTFDQLDSFWRKDCCYLLSFDHVDSVDSFAIQPSQKITEDRYDNTSHYKGYYTEYTVPDDGFVNGNYNDCVFGTRDALLEYLCRRMNITKPIDYFNELLFKSVPLIVDGRSGINIEEWKIPSMFLYGNDVDLYAINLSDGSNREILKSYIEHLDKNICMNYHFGDFYQVKGWWFYCISNTDSPFAECFNSAESLFNDWRKVKNFIKEANKA